MRVEDRLELLMSDFGPCLNRSRTGFRSINNKDIDDLLDLFRERDILIDLYDSEKEISWDMGQKIALVPFETDVYYPNIIVRKYILRSKQLEVSLTDYFHNSGGTQGVIGGNSTSTSGIVCDLKFEGDSGGEELVTKAKGILREFYL